MLITLINKTTALSNPLGDILKGMLTLTTEGRFYIDQDMFTTEGRIYLDKDMFTTLINYDHPRYPGVDLARPHCLVSQSNHTYSL